MVQAPKVRDTVLYIPCGRIQEEGDICHMKIMTYDTTGRKEKKVY